MHNHRRSRFLGARDGDLQGFEYMHFRGSVAATALFDFTNDLAEVRGYDYKFIDSIVVNAIYHMSFLDSFWDILRSDRTDEDVAKSGEARYQVDTSTQWATSNLWRPDVNVDENEIAIGLVRILRLALKCENESPVGDHMFLMHLPGGEEPSAYVARLWKSLGDDTEHFMFRNPEYRGILESLSK